MDDFSPTPFPEIRHDLTRYNNTVDRMRDLNREMEMRVRDLRNSVERGLNMLRIRHDIPLFNVEEIVGGTYTYREILRREGAGYIEHSNVRNVYVEDGKRKSKKMKKSRFAEEGGRTSIKSYVDRWPFDEPQYLVTLAERVDDIGRKMRSGDESVLDIKNAPLMQRVYG